jgi:hypothetical protein
MREVVVTALTVALALVSLELINPEASVETARTPSCAMDFIYLLRESEPR